MNEIKLENFSGPLDLLLSLIDNQKLDINEVALSTVTEQYLHHLDKIEEKKPEDLADFLVVATRLLLLKSSRLLPQFGISDEEAGPTLEEQLRLYKAFVEASKKLNKLWLRNRHSIFRIEPPRCPKEFVAAENFGLSSLRESMERLLFKLTPPKPLPQTHIDKAITIKEKIEQIRKIFQTAEKIGFSQLINNNKNRTEVIVSFLALLELVKQKTIALNQDDNFGEIVINKV